MEQQNAMPEEVIKTNLFDDLEIQKFTANTKENLLLDRMIFLQVRKVEQ